MGTTLDATQHEVMKATHQLNGRLTAIAQDLERESSHAMSIHSSEPSSYPRRHEVLMEVATQARDRLNVVLLASGAVDDTTIKASHERRMRETRRELLSLAGNIGAYLDIQEHDRRATV